MRTYYLEEMTWPEIEKALAEGYKTVVIFSGAVEQHGNQSPCGGGRLCEEAGQSAGGTCDSSRRF